MEPHARAQPEPVPSPVALREHLRGDPGHDPRALERPRERLEEAGRHLAVLEGLAAGGIEAPDDAGDGHVEDPAARPAGVRAVRFPLGFPELGVVDVRGRCCGAARPRTPGARDPVVHVVEERNEDRRVEKGVFEFPVERLAGGRPRFGAGFLEDAVGLGRREVGARRSGSRVEEGEREVVRIVVVGDPAAEHDVDAFVLVPRLDELGHRLRGDLDLDAEVPPDAEEGLGERRVLVHEDRVNADAQPDGRGQPTPSGSARRPLRARSASGAVPRRARGCRAGSGPWRARRSGRARPRRGPGSGRRRRGRSGGPRSTPRRCSCGRRRSTCSSSASRRGPRESAARGGSTRGPAGAGRARCRASRPRRPSAIAEARERGPELDPRRRAPAPSRSAGCARERRDPAVWRATWNGPVPDAARLPTRPARPMAVRGSVRSDGKIGRGSARRITISAVGREPRCPRRPRSCPATCSGDAANGGEGRGHLVLAKAGSSARARP